ncbi:MAG: hypothetical protein HYW22_00555 [Candidatus Aenigmarchaeota archaeon]|nr:hypothetical protein [Candidatus Aenigmarchaeota archaeon]
MDEVKDGFLLDIRVKNPDSGRKTLLYVRDYQGHSHVVERDMDDHFVSDRLSFIEADELEKSLRGTSLVQYNPRIFNSGSMYVVVLYGPRELKSDLEFKKATKVYRMVSKPEVSLKLRYPPLLAIKNGTVTMRKVRPEHLLQDTFYGLDIELTGMNTDNPLIYMVAGVSGKGNTIFTLYDTGTDWMDIDGHHFRVERADSIPGLVELVKQDIIEKDPLWIYGHNLMDFDLPHLRRSGDFRIGIGGTEPRIEGGIPGFHSFRAGKEKNQTDKVVVDGRFVIDTLAWSRNNLGLPNNTLPTVAQNHGIPMEKEIKGDEFDVLGERAKYDRGVAFKIARYCARDTLTTVRIGQLDLPQIVIEAIDFETDPTTVCFTGNSVTNYYSVRTQRSLLTLGERRQPSIDMNDKKLVILGMKG